MPITCDVNVYCKVLWGGNLIKILRFIHDVIYTK